MASSYELLGILLGSFILNLAPFVGPSNLLIAMNAALLVNADPWIVGFLVALGSTSAKFLHYLVAFFVRGLVSERRKEVLNEMRQRVRRWAFIALYVVAATPIPDEPVIIPLGLLRYSPAKFCLAYFAGKLSITVPGAYVGSLLKVRFEPLIGQEIMAVISIVMTIAITIILLKIDVSRALQSIKRKCKAISRRATRSAQTDAVGSRLEAARSALRLELAEGEGHFPLPYHQTLDVVPAFATTLKASAPSEAAAHCCELFPQTLRVKASPLPIPSHTEGKPYLTCR